MKTTFEAYESARKSLSDLIIDQTANLADRVRAASLVRSGSAIQKNCHNILCQEGQIAEDDQLYVKTNGRVVSQLSLKVTGRAFLVCIMDGVVELYSFLPEEIRPFGTSPHGRIRVSDAVRVKMTNCPQLFRKEWSQCYGS